MPMFGGTAHCINGEFGMKEIILALKNVEWPHTSTNLACLLKNILGKSKISCWLSCITANNTTNNATMAFKLHNLTPHIDPAKKIYGFVAHVINLAAKARTEVFDWTRPPSLISSLKMNFQMLINSQIFVEPTTHAEMHSVSNHIQAVLKNGWFSSQVEKATYHTISTLPEGLPWRPESEVDLEVDTDGASEATDTQGILPSQILGPD